MPELRWTLLILGALFIGALALWELRRQKHARGQGREGDRVTPTLDEGGDRDAAPDASRGDTRMFREPTLTFPDHPESRGDRAPISDPRVVEMDDASLAGLKVDSQKVVDEFSDPARPAPASAADERDDDYESIGPMVATRSAPQADDDEDDDRDEDRDDDRDDEVAESDDSDSRRASTLAPTLGQYEDAVVRDGAQPMSALAGDPFAVTEPVVEWPDEEVRKIVALRLVSGAGERFAGRTVRLALAAEGFVLGKFEIFHKPGPDGRAVLSAASLTKPGSFSLNTMDAQRFGGLSLFAVLPGPLSPVATFDELLVTARSLNDRLRGALQDERGEPLTPVRCASIREGLAAAVSGSAPVVSSAASNEAQDSSPA
jgi:FtsZ-interacting cell division protein ZipA